MFLILFNVLESEGDDVLEMVSGNVFPWYQTRSEIIESSILNKLMPKWSDPDGDFKLDSEKIFRHLKDTSKGVCTGYGTKIENDKCTCTFAEKDHYNSCLCPHLGKTLTNYST